MAYYFVRLIPPRPDFIRTMTEAERRIMEQHGAYWARFAAEGWAVAYGPVLDPSGAYGAGFWDLPADADPHTLLAADPVMVANIGCSMEIHPMAALVVGCRPQ